MGEIFGYIIGILGAMAAVGTPLGMYIKSRGENKNSATTAKQALDARIDARVTEQLTEAWERIDKLEKDVIALNARQTRRDGAITRILRAIAKQWPNAEGPNLDPSDIAEIEETVPAEWIRKNPPSKSKET